MHLTTQVSLAISTKGQVGEFNLKVGFALPQERPVTLEDGVGAQDEEMSAMLHGMPGTSRCSHGPVECRSQDATADLPEKDVQKLSAMAQRMGRG